MFIIVSIVFHSILTGAEWCCDWCLVDNFIFTFIEPENTMAHCLWEIFSGVHIKFSKIIIHIIDLWVLLLELLHFQNFGWFADQVERMNILIEGKLWYDWLCIWTWCNNDNFHGIIDLLKCSLIIVSHLLSLLINNAFEVVTFIL